MSNGGGYSQIVAELNMMSFAIKSRRCYDYFHLLSGSDYPCVNQIVFDKFFEDKRGCSFMHFDSEAEIFNWRDSKYNDRVAKWYLHDVQWIPSRLKSIVSRLLNIMVKRKPIPDVVAGWNWFSWHRSLVNWVLDYLGRNPSYLKRFKYTTCCDEVIFHTLLYRRIEELNIEPYNSLRYIDWHPNRPYASLPLILDERDFLSIVNSKALFCRKVDEKLSKRLMDLLDKNMGE